MLASSYAGRFSWGGCIAGDSYSPVKGVHWTMDSPPLSPVQEGQPGAAVAVTDIEAATDVANRTPPQMSSIS